MLKHLHITNFAILSDVAIDLAPGFNVLTGETGAGKSLIVDAVALLRGGRASADIPRAGADEAVVEAVFLLPGDVEPLVAEVLDEHGLPPCEDGELVVRRVIAVATKPSGGGKTGRSRIHVNGGLTTANVLSRLGGFLVELAGQHEHQGLVDPSRHVDILDAFGVPPGLVGAVREAYEQLQEARAALDIHMDAKARAERVDLLKFQIEELDTLKPRVGEQAELEGQRERLRSAGKLVEVARRGEERLYAGDGAVAEVLGGLAHDLAGLARLDPALEPPRRMVEEARVLTEEAARELGRYADGINDDPGALDEVEGRLHGLQKLARKHGVGLDALAARWAALAEELQALEEHDDRRAAAEKLMATAQRAAAVAAEKLTAARIEAGTRLATEATAALAELRMGSARLTVQVSPRPAGFSSTGVSHAGRDEDLVVAGRRFGPRGWDRVEMLLCANRGEEPKALARVASGGELSRIMLALKLVLRRADQVGTYVFDEVDAGTGGATAEVIGRQIAKVAQGRQVICVTHLPQIAALADTHLHVEKEEADGRTETYVRTLSPDARETEIARMLGGIQVTERTRAAARELIGLGRGTAGVVPNPAQTPKKSRGKKSPASAP